MSGRGRLELTWVGKDQRPRLEPRILLEDPAQSYRGAKAGITDNLLIHGDNLLALKALEAEYAGKVKCIYIDPPYNTGSAFTHYDDGMEHSIWLSMMRDRLELLWVLLSDDGTLWISIDDREMPYLRVLMDEIAGRNCFLASNVWQKRYSRENRGAIGDAHEYVLAFAKNPEAFGKARNMVPMDAKSSKVYRNPNNDPRGPWRPIPMTAQGFRPNQMYAIRSPGQGELLFHSVISRSYTAGHVDPLAAVPARFPVEHSAPLRRSARPARPTHAGASPPRYRDDRE